MVVDYFDFDVDFVVEKEKENHLLAQFSQRVVGVEREISCELEFARRYRFPTFFVLFF